MRVTTKMLTQSLMNNINNNLGKLQEYENQLSSNVKVDKVSDDPIAAAQILNAKSELNSQQQYSTNMSYASSYQTTVNDALSSAYDVLESARESAVSVTGTTTPDSMKALADQVDGLIGSMVQVANTDYNGSYVFAGGETSTAPFTLTQDSSGNDTGVQFISNSYNADSLDQTYSQKIEIASGVTIDLAAGKTTFHTDSSGNTALNSVFNTLITLKNNLNSGSTSAVSSSLSTIDGLITNVTTEQAVGGAKSDRIESAQSRAATYTDNLTALISNLQDADYAQATTDYSSQQAVYQASLSVGAKIIQPSLLDFLK